MLLPDIHPPYHTTSAHCIFVLRDPKQGGIGVRSAYVSMIIIASQAWVGPAFMIGRVLRRMTRHGVRGSACIDSASVREWRIIERGGWHAHAPRALVIRTMNKPCIPLSAASRGVEQCIANGLLGTNRTETNGSEKAVPVCVSVLCLNVESELLDGFVFTDSVKTV